VNAVKTLIYTSKHASNALHHARIVRLDNAKDALLLMVFVFHELNVMMDYI